MRRSSARREYGKLGILAACLALAACDLRFSLAEEAAAADQPIFWRQHTFAIPFRVHRQPGAPDVPADVELYVSSDRGQTWRLAEKVEPAAGQFNYRAQQDGEYWFDIRTRDASGEPSSNEPLRAGLKVLVDTAPPGLKIEAVRGDSGQVQVSWSAQDDNLKPDSLKIEMQAPGQAWQTLSIDEANEAGKSGVREGRADWWPGASDGPLLLRAEVTDQAGNRTISKATAALARNEQESAGENASGGADAGRTAGTSPNADSQSSQAVGRQQRRAPTTSTTNAPGGGPTVPQAWPPDGITRDPFQRHAAHQTARNRGHRQSSADTQADSSITRMASTSIPAGVTPRFVNSTTFQLEYDILSVGSSGLAKVELWATRDGGRHWELLALDDDTASPISAQVDFEGVYGFRIVVESGTGLRSGDPVSGDAPEIWIVVDLSRPTCRLVSYDVAHEGDDPSVTIRWEADDAHLDDAPIALSHAASPKGPWKTIKKNLPPQGTYIWSPAEEAENSTYLRITARDQAENVGEAISIEPVVLRTERPAGRIRGLLPLGRSAVMDRLRTR